MTAAVSLKAGGCITKQWSCGLEVSEQVVDLLSAEPGLITRFERLHERHAKRLPRVLGWGEQKLTVLHLDPHRTACLLTSCDKRRGLYSVCWYASDPSQGGRRSSRPSRSPSPRGR